MTLHHSLDQFFYLLIFGLVVFFCLLEFNVLWDLLDDLGQGCLITVH